MCFQVSINENMDIATRNTKETKHDNKKKKFVLNSFQVPYFKAPNGACPPENIDVQMKRASEDPALPKIWPRSSEYLRRVYAHFAPCHFAPCHFEMRKGQNRNGAKW
jgi:hypothetical protein